MAGRKFLNAAEKRVRSRRGQKRKIVIERPFIQLWRHRRVREDRFYLRGEQEAAACLVKVKRLNTDAIARQNQLLAFAVPQRDGKVAFNFFHKIEAALFIEMNDCFAVSS